MTCPECGKEIIQEPGRPHIRHKECAKIHKQKLQNFRRRNGLVKHEGEKKDPLRPPSHDWALTVVSKGFLFFYQ